MATSSSHISRQLSAKSAALCAIALCAGLFLSGCGRNGGSQSSSGDEWREVDSSDGNSITELNLASIRVSSENANWRDYQYQNGPRGASVTAEAIRTYTVVDATMDCADRSMRINSQRTYFKPYGKGEQVSHYPGQPMFVKVENTPHGQQMIPLVCN